MGDLVNLGDVTPLAQTKEGEDAVGAEVRDLEQRKAEAELQEQLDQIKHRRWYAGLIFVFVSVWVASIFAVLLADGWALWGLDIADSVMVTLVGGTTISVLGLFAVVANYFFPKPPAG